MVELVVVVSIVMILTAFLAVNLPNLQSSSSINAAVDELIPEIRQQQMKAIQGDTEGRASGDNYGIHFDATQYVLYHGITYNPADPDNIIIPLKNNIETSSVAFLSNNLLFASVSGEVVNFVSGSNSIVLRDTNNTNQTKSIQINRYGIVVQIN